MPRNVSNHIQSCACLQHEQKNAAYPQVREKNFRGPYELPAAALYIYAIKMLMGQVSTFWASREIMYLKESLAQNV